MRDFPLWALSATLLMAACSSEPTPPGGQVPAGAGVAGEANGGAVTGGGSTAVAGATTGGNAGSGAGGAGSGGVATPRGGSSNNDNGGSGGSAISGTAGSASGAGGSSAGQAGQAGGGGAAVDAHFELAWRDDFDSFDDGRWSKQTHTFEENLSRFTTSNVVVEGGLLKLRVTKTPSQDREYSGAEVASKQQFSFGRFASRIKFCAGSGIVSSLFTYQQDVSESWQEIDIEHLGYLPQAIQYNLISGTSDNRVYQPKVVSFSWSPTTDFHDYVIEWSPDGVQFFVDGLPTHRDVQSKIKDGQTLRMNAWPTNNAVTAFAGTFDPAAVPCEAQYDWVEAYTYSP